MDRLTRNVPGMESFLRCRDLPSFCRVSDTNNSNLQLVVRETYQSPRAHAIMFNTFEDLEGPIISHIRTLCPKIYTIGPLHAHLKLKLSCITNSLPPNQSSSNILFDADKSCMSWLDSQPSKSVIYVSFGSVAVITRHELMEFWYGLVNSKKRFLWVARPDMVAGEGDAYRNILEELLEGTKEMGYMVGWAPQKEVLEHPALGGFMTHSGWNSTLESIVAGVPMICWPRHADQPVNSRFVSEVWKLGVEMKDVCDRNVVERMVNVLMEQQKEEFRREAEMMTELAWKSVKAGGSSYCNLECLIEDIRLTSINEAKT